MVRAQNVAAESLRRVSMQSPTPPTASNVLPNSSGVEAVGGVRGGVAILAFVTIAVGGCALDLFTKSWIFGRLGYQQVQQGTPSPPTWLIGNVFGFETSLNEGAVFGVGQGQVVAFATLSVIAALGIILWLIFARTARDLHLTLALSFVMAGILGNLYDRLGLHALTWENVYDRAGRLVHQAGAPVYAVRDWLHFKIDLVNFDWPIFNLADSFLVCGAILLVWHAIRHRD